MPTAQLFTAAATNFIVHTDETSLPELGKGGSCVPGDPGVVSASSASVAFAAVRSSAGRTAAAGAPFRERFATAKTARKENGQQTASTIKAIVPPLRGSVSPPAAVVPAVAAAALVSFEQHIDAAAASAEVLMLPVSGVQTSCSAVC